MIYFFLFDFNLVQIDFQMRSPPSSPSEGLQGALRITGGTIRGRARGNVFNFADGPDMFCDEVGGRPKVGKVLLYTSMGDPETTKPAMSLKHEVSPTLAPVLAKLAKRYTRINSMFFLLNVLEFGL